LVCVQFRFGCLTDCIAYRDKKVVGVFVRFFVAPGPCLLTHAAAATGRSHGGLYVATDDRLPHAVKLVPAPTGTLAVDCGVLRCLRCCSTTDTLPACQIFAGQGQRCTHVMSGIGRQLLSSITGSLTKRTENFHPRVH
jgi:hypothetical protein